MIKEIKIIKMDNNYNSTEPRESYAHYAGRLTRNVLSFGSRTLDYILSSGVKTITTHEDHDKRHIGLHYVYHNGIKND